MSEGSCNSDTGGLLVLNCKTKFVLYTVLNKLKWICERLKTVMAFETVFQCILCECTFRLVCACFKCIVCVCVCVCKCLCVCYLGCSVEVLFWQQSVVVVLLHYSEQTKCCSSL